MTEPTKSTFRILSPNGGIDITVSPAIDLEEAASKFREAINGTVAFGRWIRAEDRLPDEDVWVLTLQTDGDMVVNCIAFEGQWCCNDHGFIPTVTHWMALPDKPAI
jgi:hypothetical protein